MLNIILITVILALLIPLCLCVLVVDYIASLHPKARSAEAEAGKHNHTQKSHNR